MKKILKKSTLPKLSSESKNSKKKILLSGAISKDSKKDTKAESQISSQASKPSSTQSATTQKNDAPEVKTWDTPPQTLPTISLSELIKESAPKAATPKKRGRPSLADLAARAGQSSPSDSLSKAPLQSSDQNAVVATPAALGSPKITVPDAALRPLLKTPFRLAKLKTGFKGWELSDDDADEIVPALRAVIDQYSGAIDSPHAAAYALAGSILILAGTKYIAFMEWKKDQAPQEIVQTQPTAPQGFETVRGSA